MADDLDAEIDRARKSIKASTSNDDLDAEINSARESLGSRALSFAKENVGPMVGGMIGGGLGGPPGAALGGMAGLAYQDLARSYQKPETAPKTYGEEISRLGIEGASQFLGAKYLPPVTGTISEKAGNFLGAGYKYVAKNITGLSDDAMKSLYDNPSGVMQYAKLGVEKAAEVSSDAAKQFKSLIDANIEAASDTYGKLIGIVRSNVKYGPGFKLNLQEGIGQKIADIQKEYGYALPGRVPEARESEKFLEFMRRANEMSSATPEEVYWFQRDLTNAIRNNKGKSISSALAKVKNGVMDYIETSIPEIAPANAVYRRAMELADDLSRVVNADDAASVIKRALRRNTETKDAILKASDEIAGARKTLEEMAQASAGKEFAPWMSNPIKTGYGFGVYGTIGAGIAAGSPTAKMAAIGSLPFLSPRLIGMGAQAAAGLSNLASQYGRQAVSATAPIPSALAAQGIEHYYRLYK